MRARRYINSVYGSHAQRQCLCVVIVCVINLFPAGYCPGYAAAFGEWGRDARSVIVAAAGEPVLSTPRGDVGATRDSAGNETEAIGERPELDTASDVFLRDQEVLLRGGELSIDVGVFYSKFEDQELSVLVQDQGQASLVLGTIEDEIFEVRLRARYGVSAGLQLFGGLPYTQRESTLRLQSSDQSTVSNENIVHRDEWGDISLGMRWTVTDTRRNSSDVILSLEGRIPVDSDAGSNGLGAGVAMIKNMDPAILFANLNYLRVFSRDFEDVTRLQPEHTLSSTLGYAVALNDMLSINQSLTAIFTRRSEFDNAILPSRERFSVQFGLTTLLSKRLYMEPAVAFDISGTGSNFEVGVNFPYSLGP